jgi:Circularly permutated YpsA SLOG family
VGDSDATVLFSIEPILTGGSLKTIEFARKHKKPRLHLHSGVADAADRLRMFVKENSMEVLNVAGPRASNQPGVGEFVMSTLDKAFIDIGG